MKIDGGSANKTTRTYKRFSVIIIVTLVIFMISGSTMTMSYAAPQTLPSCTDPTGQNLRCMMVISTLPPPPNALQCQETSGQILPCSYTTQSLSNGEQIVAITVYVPASYVFSGYGPWTIVKQVVHETKTRIVHVPECPKGQTLDPKTHKCVDIPYCPPPKGYHIDSITHKCVPDNCQPGQVYNPNTGKCETQKPCERPDADAKTDPDKNLKTKDCDIGDANEHGMTPLPCKDNTTCPIKPPFNCNSPGYNGTCPTENMTKGNMSSIMNPLNMTSNMSSVISKPPGTNLTANTSSAASTPSGGKSTGTSCTNNCTTGTPPPVDCTKNPTDPSCTQSLAPSTATPPLTSGAPTSPTTKTCPDGSVIDASATCPTSTTPSTPPPTSSPPPSTGNQGSPDNNPSPPSNSIPPPSSSGGSGGSGSSGNGGSSTSP